MAKGTKPWFPLNGRRLASREVSIFCPGRTITACSYFSVSTLTVPHPTMSKSCLYLDICLLPILKGNSRGKGVLPYMGYIGMCSPKGYGFSAVLVINRVSILSDLGHKLGMVFVL